MAITGMRYVISRTEEAAARAAVEALPLSLIPPVSVSSGPSVLSGEATGRQALRDAARWRFLERQTRWEGEHDFAPGGRWWLTMLTNENGKGFCRSKPVLIG